MAKSVRVDACLPLQIKTLTAGEVDLRRKAVLGGPQVREQASSSIAPRYDRNNVLAQLSARMESLEAKIDDLVALVLQEQQKRARELAVNLELGGDGLTFRWPESVAVGEVMELDMGLTLFPPREISFLAQVQDCQPEHPAQEGEPPPHFLISAQFVAISEDDRDAIHRFLINAQRQKRRADRAV